MNEEELHRVTQELFGIIYLKNERYPWIHHFYNSREWVYKNARAIDKYELIRPNKMCSSRTERLYCLSINFYILEVIGYIKSSEHEVNVYSQRINMGDCEFYFVFHIDFRREKFDHILIDIVNHTPDGLICVYRNEEGKLKHNEGLLTKACR